MCHTPVHAHSQKLSPPSSTSPSSEHVLTHRSCQACHRRHHDIRQHYHPPRIHLLTSVVETLQCHAVGIRHRPCGRRNTAPPLVPSTQHLLQNDAPGWRTTSNAPSSFDPRDPDLGFPPEHPETNDANCHNGTSRKRHRRRHHRLP